MSSELIKKKIRISSNLRNLRNIIAKATVKDLAKITKIPEKSLSMYESGYKTPSLSNLVIFTECFGVSMDFLLLWDNAVYPRSLKMLSLAGNIDKMDELKRFQIVTTINTLLDSQNPATKEIKFDDFNLNLSVDFHENARIMRERKEISQTQAANDLNLKQARISAYERMQIPKLDTLSQLSNYYGISIHALTTGQKLCYSFKNGDLLEIILQADRLLTLDDKEFLIKLMERIIQNEAK